MNQTDMYDEMAYALKINNFLAEFIFYSCSLVVVCYLLGNMLNILVCARKRIRKEMMGFYNIVISFWNIMVLLSALFLYFPPSIHVQDLLLRSNFSCATINFVMRVCVQMSAWLHVFLTLDRYLCVIFNNRLKFIFNDRIKLSLIFLGLLVIICVINMPNLFFRVSLNAESNLKCDSTPLINQIRNIIISIFRIILPILFQMVLSSLLIYKLFKLSRNFNTNKSMEKEYKFARIILWLNLMFIITEMPYLIATLCISLLGIPTMLKHRLTCNHH